MRRVLTVLFTSGKRAGSGGRTGAGRARPKFARFSPHGFSPRAGTNLVSSPALCAFPPCDLSAVAGPQTGVARFSK